MRGYLCAATLVLCAGCIGDLGEGPPPVTVPETGVSEVGLRRLTAYEYDNTVADLLLDDTRPGFALLPEDLRTPYDNDYRDQRASQVLIEAAEYLATDIAARFVADAGRRDEVVPCQPSGVDDSDCLRSFVTTFGRRALRRTLSADEIESYVDFGADYAEQGDDFYTGVEVLVSAFLQDSEFLYRVERGVAVEGHPGVYQLGGFEIATRMSYLLWATMPDDALLDLAEQGALGDPAAFRNVAVSMLADDKARTQIDRFHAMWLGYEKLPHPADLTNAMRSETAALVDRVIFDDKSSWLELFTSTESYLDDDLANHYGVSAPGSSTPVWTDVSADGRRGIIGHGSFLSAGTNPSDTSPTQRGKFIRERVMCQEMPPPPPDVMADEPPAEDIAECKYDRYEVHRVGACAACHAQMDGIGFGLENYDREGRYREHDDGKPQCSIAGDGEITGVGTFNGAAELATLLVDSGRLEECVTEQLFQFAMGHPVLADDGPRVDQLVAQFKNAGTRFDELVLSMVLDPAFRLRREEQPSEDY